MKLKIVNAILIIDILTIFLMLSIIFIPSTAMRVILGIPFLLFFPGYSLVAALFVKKEGIDNIERIALSFGMSVAISALLGFGLNYTSWGIRLDSVLYCITAFILVTSAIALTMRIIILKKDKLTTEFTLKLPGWDGSTLNKSLSIILAAAIFGSLGTLGYTILKPKIGEKFAEFYILGPDGKADDYPTQFTLNNGQITQVVYGDGSVDTTRGFGAVILGIINQEQQTAIYTVKITINGEPVKIDFDSTIDTSLEPIELQQGEKWENEIGIIPDQAGDNQKVELSLFSGTETTAEDSLYFWISVKPA